MKYIMFDLPGASLPAPIFFSAPQTHVQIAAVFETCGWKPVSAGYYDPMTGKCFSESLTIALKPGPQDEKIIRCMVGATLRTAIGGTMPLPPAGMTDGIESPMALKEQARAFLNGASRDHITGEMGLPSRPALGKSP